MKERAATIKATRTRLTGMLLREPTVSELCAETGFTPEEIATAELATASAESIHKENGEDGFTLEDVLTEGDMEDTIVERIALREAISQLPERERTVIDLRYFHGLTQDRTAKLLGISQVQVSRIEKRAVQSLRTYF
jgi:RNA polymerase sporulation-specific sigma factor